MNALLRRFRLRSTNEDQKVVALTTVNVRNWPGAAIHVNEICAKRIAANWRKADVSKTSVIAQLPL